MAIVEEVSRITAKGQTTVPASVRRALGVGAGGRIAFRLEQGQVTVRKAEPAEDEADPVVTAFLAFLAQDMERRPEGLVPLTQEMLDRSRALTAGMVADLDEPIEGEVAL